MSVQIHYWLVWARFPYEQFIDDRKKNRLRMSLFFAVEPTDSNNESSCVFGYLTPPIYLRRCISISRLTYSVNDICTESINGCFLFPKGDARLPDSRRFDWKCGFTSSPPNELVYLSLAEEGRSWDQSFVSSINYCTTTEEVMDYSTPVVRSSPAIAQ